jgi:hypothetical protein
MAHKRLEKGPLHPFLGAAAAGCVAVATLGGAPLAGPVQFVPHVIYANFRGGPLVADH